MSRYPRRHAALFLAALTVVPALAVSPAAAEDL